VGDRRRSKQEEEDRLDKEYAAKEFEKYMREAVNFGKKGLALFQKDKRSGKPADSDEVGRAFRMKSAP
jgi:hypothetical protein